MAVAGELGLVGCVATTAEFDDLNAALVLSRLRISDGRGREGGRLPEGLLLGEAENISDERFGDTEGECVCEAIPEIVFVIECLDGVVGSQLLKRSSSPTDEELCSLLFSSRAELAKFSVASVLLFASNIDDERASGTDCAGSGEKTRGIAETPSCTFASRL